MQYHVSHVVIASSKGDTKPKGVIYVPGCYIEQKPNITMERQGLFEFEMSTLSGGSKDKRLLYAITQKECDKWVSELQKASCKVSIEEFYEIGRELGKGRFSHVHEAIHKVSNLEGKIQFLLAYI